MRGGDYREVIDHNILTVKEMNVKEDLLRLVEQNGTPLFILDHDKIRENYRTFKKHLPRVQCYYAVKANSTQQIVETLFKEGSSFDVASYNEFMQVYQYIKHFDTKEKKNLGLLGFRV